MSCPTHTDTDSPLPPSTQPASLAPDSLQSLRWALDQHAIVSSADLQGNISEVNDKFCEISGYTREELLGRNHRLLKSERHPPSFYRAIWSTISSGQVWQGEICNRRKDGREYWVRSTIAPILGSDGMPCQYISVRTDITPIKEAELALQKRETLFRTLFTSVAEGIVLHDAGGQVLECNPATERILGLNREQILGRTSLDPMWRCIHPDGTPFAGDQHPAMRTLASGQPQRDIVMGIYRPDGSLRWINIASEPIYLPEAPERIAKVVVSFTDITHMRDTQQRLSLAIEGSGDGIWDWDVRSGAMPLSGHYEAMLGYERGEIEPTLRTWAEMAHPEDLPRVQAALQAYLSGQAPAYSVELRLRCKDGRYKWIHCRGTVVERDAQGQPSRMIGMHSDISERKQAEEQLLVFRRLVESTDQAIRVSDSAGLIQYVNPAYEQLMGYSKEEALGQPFTRLSSVADQQALTDEILARLHEGQGWRGHLKLRRKDGSTFVSLSNVRSITDPRSGAVQHSFNMFVDYSEEIARQQALELAVKEANAANQAKSAFLSSMSHELRTPLNAVIGFAQMLEYDPGLDELQQDSVHEIIKAGRHLLDLINEVLDLAKIEAGRIDLSIEPVELAALVQECQQLIQPLAAERGIHLDLACGAAHLVHADRIRLKQVLLNLLSNAIKYNREQGSVTLQVMPVGERLRITVCDTGIGIPTERLAEVFQPFNRLGAESSGIEGTGIGLCITQRLVQMMKGEIGVDSELHIGSRFWIELPGSLAPSMPASTTPDSPDAQQGTAAEERQRVLCIDDNPVNLKLIAQILRLRPHIQLDSAHTPELGIELARVHQPDLILLDINMPGMDGYQVLEYLKSQPGLCGIPVVAVTANAMPRDIIRGLEAGFTDYLTKPLDIGSFLETLDQLLEQRAGRS